MSINDAANYLSFVNEVIHIFSENATNKEMEKSHLLDELLASLDQDPYQFLHYLIIIYLRKPQKHTDKVIKTLSRDCFPFFKQEIYQIF